MLEHLPTEGHLREPRYVSVIITELSGADIQQLRQDKGPGNNTEASHYLRRRPPFGQF